MNLEILNLQNFHKCTISNANQNNSAARKRHHRELVEICISTYEHGQEMHSDQSALTQALHSFMITRQIHCFGMPGGMPALCHTTPTTLLQYFQLL